MFVFGLDYTRVFGRGVLEDVMTGFGCSVSERRREGSLGGGRFEVSQVRWLGFGGGDCHTRFSMHTTTEHDLRFRL